MNSITFFVGILLAQILAPKVVYVLACAIFIICIFDPTDRRLIVLIAQFMLVLLMSAFLYIPLDYFTYLHYKVFH